MLQSKRFLSLLLSTAIIFTSSSNAFAGQETNNFRDDEIILTSFKQDSDLDRSASQNIVITYTEDNRGNHQIFTYQDDALIEINSGGMGVNYITTEKIQNGKVIATEVTEILSQDIHIPTLQAYLKEGKITYTNPFTDTTLGINLYLDTQDVYKETRIEKGYYSYAKLLSYMISAWALPTFAAKAIVPIIFGNFVIEDGLQVLATKKVEGTVYNYTWKGVPTDSSRGDTEYMDGIKVEYKDDRGRDKVYTKGYQDDEFETRNLTFGRLMFYGVYGIEEHPTTWE